MCLYCSVLNYGHPLLLYSIEPQHCTKSNAEIQTYFKSITVYLIKTREHRPVTLKGLSKVLYTFTLQPSLILVH